MVAAVMCSADSVKLRASEGPGHKGPKLGEMLHLPILSYIGVADFGGYSLGFGDVPDPHVSVGGIVSGPGPPDPELGDTLRLPDFSTDIDPGAGESFPVSGSMLVRSVLLDDCVPNSGRYLPESGVMTDGPGSTNDCGTGSGEPFPVCEGCCQDGMRGTPLRTNMRGLLIKTELGYNYVTAMTICRRGMNYIGRGQMY